MPWIHICNMMTFSLLYFVIACLACLVWLTSSGHCQCTLCAEEETMPKRSQEALHQPINDKCVSIDFPMTRESHELDSILWCSTNYHLWTECVECMSMRLRHDSRVRVQCAFTMWWMIAVLYFPLLLFCHSCAKPFCAVYAYSNGTIWDLCAENIIHKITFSQPFALSFFVVFSLCICFGSGLYLLFPFCNSVQFNWFLVQSCLMCCNSSNFV